MAADGEHCCTLPNDNPADTLDPLLCPSVTSKSSDPFPSDRLDSARPGELGGGVGARSAPSAPGLGVNIFEELPAERGEH